MEIETNLEGNDAVIGVPLNEYKDLVQRSYWLSCLEDAGVDNWEGISYAYELFEEYDKEI